MKRQKKRGPKYPSEAPNHSFEDTSQTVAPARRGLSELDERIINMERVTRGRGRQKTTTAQNGPRHQRRQSSLPSRTSPPIHTHTHQQPHAHQVKDESGNKRQVSSIRNRCGWCELKSRRRGRQTMRPGRRLEETGCFENTADWREVNPSGSSDSLDQYSDLPTSPGPATYQGDSRDWPDHQTFETKRPDRRTYSTTRRDKGDFQLTQKRLPYRDSDRFNRPGAKVYSSCCPYQPMTSNNSSASSHPAVEKYDCSDLSANEKSQHWSCVPNCPSFTGGANLKYDSKADYLLAKYSNYNSYPRMPSPITPFLPYKSSFIRSVMSETGSSAVQKNFLSQQYLGWSSGLCGLNSRSLHHMNLNYNKCLADPYSHNPITISRPKNPNWAEKLWQQDRHSSVRFKLRNQASSLLWTSTDSRWLQPWTGRGSWTAQISHSPWNTSKPLAEADSTICDKFTNRQNNNAFYNTSGNNINYSLGGHRARALLSAIILPGRDVTTGSYLCAAGSADKKEYLNFTSNGSHTPTRALKTSLVEKTQSRSPCKNGTVSNNLALSSGVPYYDPVSMSNKRCVTSSGYVQLLRLEQTHLSSPSDRHEALTSSSETDHRSIRSSQTAAAGPDVGRSLSGDKSHDTQFVSMNGDTCQQP